MLLRLSAEHFQFDHAAPSLFRPNVRSATISAYAEDQSTLGGAGTFPESDPLALGMLGMHGTVYANYAVNDADLLLALGVRFDDRVTGAASMPSRVAADMICASAPVCAPCRLTHVRGSRLRDVGCDSSVLMCCFSTRLIPTKSSFSPRVRIWASQWMADERWFHGSAGKLETFAERARIVHIDVDPAEINKNKEAHIPMCTTTKHALVALNAALDARPLVDGQYSAWVATLAAKKEEFPMTYPVREDVIIPQRAVQASGLHYRHCLVLPATACSHVVQAQIDLSTLSRYVTCRAEKPLCVHQR